MPSAYPVILAALLALEVGSAQWFLPVYVRPEKVEPGADISGEVGARDDDAAGTNTWATKALTRTCAPQGGCAGLSSAGAVWTGFPAGYRPRRLIVYWRAASSGALFGGTAETRAAIEYSTGGDVWMPIDTFAGQGPLLIDPKIVEASLPPATDPASLRVRGRLEVEMRSCPNKDCRQDLPNASNQGGQIWISDIRLEVENPQLTTSRERARKGEVVRFRVEGAPGAETSRWKFTGVSGAIVERGSGEPGGTWSLTAGESGTVTVTVRLRGQPQIDGRPFELSKSIEVHARGRR